MENNRAALYADWKKKVKAAEEANTAYIAVLKTAYPGKRTGDSRYYYHEAGSLVQMASCKFADACALMILAQKDLQDATSS